MKTASERLIFRLAGLLLLVSLSSLGYAADRVIIGNKVSLDGCSGVSCKIESACFICRARSSSFPTTRRRIKDSFPRKEFKATWC